MEVFKFSIQIDKKLTPKLVNKIFEAGCSDCVAVRRNGLSYLHFDREAVDSATALTSIWQQLNSINIESPVSECANDNDPYLGIKVANRLKQAIKEDRKINSSEFKSDGTELIIEMRDGHQLRLKDYCIKEEPGLLVIFNEHLHPFVFPKASLNFWGEQVVEREIPKPKRDKKSKDQTAGWIGVIRKQNLKR